MSNPLLRNWLLTLRDDPPRMPRLKTPAPLLPGWTVRKEYRPLQVRKPAEGLYRPLGRLPRLLPLSLLPLRPSPPQRLHRLPSNLPR